MGVVFLKNKKGQISIEFILIILIMLTYLVAVVQPTAILAANSTEDIARLSQAKLSAQKIGTAVNELSANQGNGKKTISLFIPKNTTVACAGNIITFNAKMESMDRSLDPSFVLDGCTGGGGTIIECGGKVDLIAIPNCAFGTGSSIDGGDDGVFKKATVTKSGSGISVKYAP